MADIKIKAPDGTVRLIPDKFVNDALQAGGEFTSPEDMASYQVKQQYPNMPDSLRNALLKMSGTGFGDLAQKAEPVTGAIQEGVETARLPEMAGGFLQSAGDMVASVANIPAYAQEKMGREASFRVPHPDFGQYLPQDMASKIAFGGGELAGALLPIGGGVAATSKLGIPAQMAMGAGTGAILGEDKEGGRGLSSAIGAGTAGLLGAGQKAYRAMSNKSIAKELQQTKKSAENAYKGMYKNFFDKVDNRKIPEMIDKRPTIDVRTLTQEGDNQYLKSLKRFYSNPTLKNAHDAQSDLFKYMKNLDVTDKTKGLAYKEAQRIRNELNGNILNHLHEHNSLDLALELNNIGQGYKENVVPYLKSDALHKYSKGKISPSDLISDLLGNRGEREFLQEVGEHHPDLMRRKHIDDLVSNKYLKALLGSGLGGGALYGAYEFGKRS
jgi:hypothetical protein